MDVTGHKVVDPSTTTPPATSIRDVARVAGVSHQTVSRVINGHHSVSESARTRVESAIAELGFRPSRAARALANGRDDVVTVLTSNTGLYGYSQTIAGVEEAARAAGVRVAIRVLEPGADAIRAAVEDVSDPRAGSVVVLAFDRTGSQALAAMPDSVRWSAAVESYVGRREAREGNRGWAWFDDITASADATRHLLDLGHRTVHHMAIPSSSTIGDRQRGWRAALVDAGAPIPDVVRPRSWSMEAAHAAALDLLRDREVTAVLCGNDDQAVAVLRAAHDLGVSVPDEVSVVGFDDTPIASFCTPSLTSVRFDFVALGRRAFHDLGIGPERADAPLTVPEPALVVRESTGPAARRT